MNTQDWLKNNKAIIIAAMICMTIIIVAVLLRPPRYRHAGGKQVLDTHTGRIFFGNVRK